MLFKILLAVAFVATASGSEVYKMCVPHVIYDACVALMQQPQNGVQIECVKARDRMDCLAVVKERKADFMVVDPEDMYVAYRMQNEDFSVFSEIRTLEEPTMEFRYEGIMLVRKNSNIHSMKDLAGKKACYTGYGRNVGYKIPLTKLTKAGVIKYTTDSLPAAEKELKAFSDFFSKGCLVGRYSPDEEINALLKKKYSNLCEMCEHPDKCDYPDKYSGYEGAIRCVAENNGDVAFTKVIFVKKYFGLLPNFTAQASADDFEYFCEDGTRKSLRGPACSWAARPWQGYMGNGDINARAGSIQKALPGLYNAGIASENKDFKKQLLISEKNLVVAKEASVLPGAHLEMSRYLDVIERSTARVQPIKFCVFSPIALDKCNILKMAAFSRDIRPIFECHMKSKDECIQQVGQGDMDTTVLGALEYPAAQHEKLKPILFEQFSEDDKMVAIADKNTNEDALRKATLSFDKDNSRAVDAAIYFKSKLGVKTCATGNELQSAANGIVKIINNSELKNYLNKDLVCPDFTQKPQSEYKSCNFDFSPPRAVFVKQNVDTSKRDDVIHAFTALSEQFGHNAPKEDVFDMFFQYRSGENNVIFDDRAEKIVSPGNELPTDEFAEYLAMRCIK